LGLVPVNDGGGAWGRASAFIPGAHLGVGGGSVTSGRSASASFLETYRALIEENFDGHMVSIAGQLDLRYVPFHELINPQPLKTEVRFMPHGSDHHRLARFLETRTDKIVDWSPGRLSER